jgi:hypothetical protein
VPRACIAELVAFWFFTVHDHCVLVPGSAMNACTNCGVAVWLAHAPPVIVDPAGHVAMHDDDAPPPEFDGPLQVA